MFPVKDLQKFTFKSKNNIPIDRNKLYREMERLVHVRADLSINELSKGSVSNAAAQIAFAHLYIGLYEKIEKGEFDIDQSQK